MLLRVENIKKQFDAIHALKGVDFSVEKGEIHGLLGENGAGKSTLMNIIAGNYPPTSGKIFYKDQLVEHMTAKSSQGMGIRFIHQELNLINDLTVYENMFLGDEILTKFHTLDKKEMIARCRKVLDWMHLDVDPMQMLSQLETSRKQMVEIAKALLFDCELLIMDEPTTALTNKEINNLFQIMRQLRDDGVSIIYISHKMPEIFEICDNYTVFRDGNFVQTGKIRDINEQKATELLVGTTLVDVAVDKPDVDTEVILKADHLDYGSALRDVSFTVKRGEVVCFTGLHGAGCNELAEVLFGVIQPTGGRIELFGKEVTLGSEKQAMQASVGMVPRNRKERSIVKDMSILDNFALADLSLNHKGLLVDKKILRKKFNTHLEQQAIKLGSENDYITSLSGGNQQKVIISRWLEIDSDILILDNPTQGIDVGAKFEIYKIINELSRQGKTIIVFSSEFPEIYKIANRCCVMYKGSINETLTRQTLTEINMMYYSTGSNFESHTETSEVG